MILAAARAALVGSHTYNGATPVGIRNDDHTSLAKSEGGGQAITGTTV
jgi:hypothetical protein